MEFTQEEIKVLKLDRMTREICSLPEDRFPNYLFEPIHSRLAYDDENYHSRINNAELREVMKLKRRYNNFFQWLDAMRVYSNYREYIEASYGPFKKIRKMAEKGLVSIYLPPEPKLKKTRENKTMLESGIVPSQKEFEFDFKEWAERTLKEKEDKVPQEILDQYTINSLYLREPSKAEVKEATRAMRLAKQNRRLNNLYLDEGSSGLNIANDFYNPFRERVDKDGKYVTGISLSEAIKEQKQRELMYESEILAEELDDYVFRNNRHIEREKVEVLDIIKEMAEEGWDVHTMIGNANLGTASVKMLRSELGVHVPMSKKELKKWKKNKKKQDEALRRKRSTDSQLMRALTESNKMHRVLNEDDVLDITFDSWYNN